MALLGAVLVTPLALSGSAQAAVPGAGRPAPDHADWRLRWAPEADQEGLSAFEHVEDDRANSDPAGFPHITASGDAYRFTMTSVIRDISTDRQRNEVRGMRADDGRTVNMLDGETWRLTYQMFIPDTLQATTRFTHIMQLKAPGTGSDPILTTSLRRVNGVQRIEVHIGGGTDKIVGGADLVPLQNHWIDIDLQVHIGDAPNGWVHWTVHDGDTVAADATMTGIDTWLFDRVRPKWGIYRSLGDTSGSLHDTYLLVRHLRAYQWADSPVAPQWARYEAEGAKASGCFTDSVNGGYTGTGYVNCQNQAGGSVEWTVRSDGRKVPVTLDIWYSNATTVDRPMDVTVNGVLVAHALDFGNTPAWTDWESRTLLVVLTPGFNTIRLTATTAAGGPNLDSVELEKPFVGPMS